LEHLDDEQLKRLQKIFERLASAYKTDTV
jgi:hypothetical protein